MRCTCACVSAAVGRRAAAELSPPHGGHRVRQRRTGGWHHLRKQIDRGHILVAITQDDAFGLFVKLSVNTEPQGRCEDHRQRREA